MNKLENISSIIQALNIRTKWAVTWTEDNMASWQVYFSLYEAKANILDDQFRKGEINCWFNPYTNAHDDLTVWCWLRRELDPQNLNDCIDYLEALWESRQKPHLDTVKFKTGKRLWLNYIPGDYADAFYVFMQPDVIKMES